MNQNNIQICDLLPLYYERKLDKEQIRIVEEWIEASDENRRIALQMEKLYMASDTLFALGQIDTEKALQQVHDKMRLHKGFSLWTWTQRVAAILFVPLLIISFLERSSGKQSSPVQMIRLATNPGMIASATLPDGTKVTLNSNSSLVYPSRFDSNSRDVKLEGEAFFKVTKDATHPFVVKTPQKAAVRVYGTQFDVEAYAADKNVTATLVDGSISMSYENGNRNWTERKIVPGQAIVYSAAKQNIQVAQAAVDVVTSWKDGKLIFKNTPFNEVLKSLSRRFNVDFIVKNPKCNEAFFTGVLEKQRLERILEYFTVSSNMRFKYNANGNIRQEKQIIEIY